jgi:hypothetical protein
LHTDATTRADRRDHCGPVGVASPIPTRATSPAVLIKQDFSCTVTDIYTRRRHFSHGYLSPATYETINS